MERNGLMNLAHKLNIKIVNTTLANRTCELLCPKLCSSPIYNAEIVSH